MPFVSENSDPPVRREPLPARVSMGPAPGRVFGPRGAIVEAHAVVEDILSGSRESLADDFDAYRAHVYRVFNLCIFGANARESEVDAIAAASAFHDLGIWTDKTFDYIEPSCVRAERWIIAARRAGRPVRTTDAAAISLMISEHHKITHYRGAHERLVEAFRRADLIDLSRGIVAAGLPRSYAKALRKTFPTAGFHRALARIGTRWAIKHPTQPFPMMKF